MAQINEGNEPGLETPKSVVNRRWQNSPNWRSKSNTDEQQQQQQMGRGSGSRWEPNSRPSQPRFTRNNLSDSGEKRNSRDRTANTSRPYNRASDHTVQNDSLPEPEVPASFAEGRRLYVGNMPYMAKKEDVEVLFSSGMKHGKGYYQMYRSPVGALLA